MEDCIFCQIAADPDMRFVYSDDDCVAFLDIEPWQRGHTLIIPREHVADLLEGPDVYARLAPAVAKVSQHLIDKLGAQGVNVMCNARAVAGQSVFHLHVHVIPRYLDTPGLRSLVPTTAVRASAEQLDEVYAALEA